MILKGGQRGGAKQLAAHLLKDENDHVEVYELRGFVAGDLGGAFQETYAISRGTRCDKAFFQLILSPPEWAEVSDRDFKNAISMAEKKLGLEDQPRAIVFHEKDGRRHAHCVWSRIDANEMKAIRLSHYKFKLRDLSRELYLQHGWKMPEGLVDSQKRDPTNFTRAEWQQATRAGQDPKALKSMFAECWAVSDSRKAFVKALEERGYWLARGDRRGFVVVDFRGETYALPKWTGQRTKDVKARLGEPQSLPTLAETKALIAARMTGAIERHIGQAQIAFKSQVASLSFRKAELTQRQRNERAQLKASQEIRWTKETNRRAARLPRGLRGIWDRLTGKYRRIRGENERETLKCFRRDQAQKQALIQRQLHERQELQREIAKARKTHWKEMAQLHRDVSRYMRMNAQEPPRMREEFQEATQQQQKSRGGGRRRKRGLTPDN